jgi:TRAP-type C4-dicarboxylate transport system permease small subunit
MLRKCFETPSVLLENAAGILLTVVGVMSLANVFTRAVFQSPIYGSIEIVQYGVLSAMCLALPASALYDSHARVTLLVDALPFAGKKLFLIAVNIAGIVLFTLITVHMYKPMTEIMLRGRTTDVLKVPYYLIHVAIMLGIALTVCVLAYRLVVVLFAKKEDSREPSEDALFDPDASARKADI